MAGRPRTMVHKIDGLELAAFDVADKLFQLVPEQYLTRDPDNDEFALMWKGAINAASDAWMFTHYLGGYLRRKAGLTGTGPTGGQELIRRGAKHDYKVLGCRVAVLDPDGQVVEYSNLLGRDETE